MYKHFAKELFPSRRMYARDTPRASRRAAGPELDRSYVNVSGGAKEPARESPSPRFTLAIIHLGDDRVRMFDTLKCKIENLLRTRSPPDRIIDGENRRALTGFARLMKGVLQRALFILNKYSSCSKYCDFFTYYVPLPAKAPYVIVKDIGNILPETESEGKLVLSLAVTDNKSRVSRTLTVAHHRY